MPLTDRHTVALSTVPFTYVYLRDSQLKMHVREVFQSRRCIVWARIKSLLIDFWHWIGFQFKSRTRSVNVVFRFVLIR